MSSLEKILHIAFKEKWSTGHFNFSESDQLRAICEAAAELKSPVLVGTSEGEAKHMGYLEARALVDAFKQELGVPIFLNSDHHKSVAAAKRAIDAGYDSIHIDLSASPFEENVRGTKEIVEYANSKFSIFNLQFSIEGELGYLRGDSKIEKEKIEVKKEDYTNPDEAGRFVQKTGINRLAISVGNIHGISLDEPDLDIELIKKIRTALPENVALVLHAGSGIPDEMIKKAIEAGISNIHINTDIRLAYASALRAQLEQSEETTPYKFDASAREALKKVVKEKLELFGSVNRI
ncbi:class II fructose-bisphosphate aldolase [Candidatus Giovannonibacteria bacterium]|nr:class II fructose-bisphosphate aldolase [Candidatus Giovannonibacteria bacterium]